LKGNVLENAWLVNFDPPRAERGAVRIEGGIIAARGDGILAETDDEAVDCEGAVILPGLVNGHTHLYSALAVGMPAPAEQPRNFHEILKYVWWRLDRALDEQSIAMSARIGALEAVRCGTTTLIDHHASPNCIVASLDIVEEALREVGVRGVLCYETTDRNGRTGRAAGLEENERYLNRCVERSHDVAARFGGLVGAHAAFTLDEESLESLAAMAGRFNVGVHIHVAEDPCDEAICRREYGRSLIERLAEQGIVRPDTVFAHGTHLDTAAVSMVNDVGSTMAHNPRSNMNNAVGYAPVKAFQCPVMLGTDGIGGDMFAEARAAWLKSRDAATTVAPADVLRMVAESARRASRSLGVRLGELEVGACADVVVTDYRPATPMSSKNVAGHVLFGLDSRHVRSVMVGGKWIMRDRVLETCDEAAIRASSVHVAKAMWAKMESIH